MVESTQLAKLLLLLRLMANPLGIALCLRMIEENAHVRRRYLPLANAGQWIACRLLRLQARWLAHWPLVKIKCVGVGCVVRGGDVEAGLGGGLLGSLVDAGCHFALLIGQLVHRDVVLDRVRRNFLFHFVIVVASHEVWLAVVVPQLRDFIVLVFVRLADHADHFDIFTLLRLHHVQGFLVNQKICVWLFLLIHFLDEFDIRCGLLFILVTNIRYFSLDILVLIFRSV